MKTPATFFAIALLFISRLSIAQISPAWPLRNELIGSLQKPADTIYVQDRTKLEKLKGMKCSDDRVTFTSSTKTKESVSIVITNKPFDAKQHSIYFGDTVFKQLHGEQRIDHIAGNFSIDGKTAYGTAGGKPTTEVAEIRVTWGNTQLSIPDSAYHNLYQLHLCLDYLPVEAYIAGNGKLLYVYAYASDGAGSYAVKFVFNRKGYVTRLISQCEIADGYDFLDATATSPE